MKKVLYMLAALAIASCPARSQDRSVITVGNRMIFESEIRGRMETDKRPYEEVAKELTVEKMLAYQADREGITVTREEVEAEVKRINGTFPDEASFINSLARQNLSLAGLKVAIEDRMKRNKLIRQKVIGRIDISQSEIIDEMKQVLSNLGNSYNLRLKWFQSKEEGISFTEGFNPAKEGEMSESQWFLDRQLLPEVLAEIKNVRIGTPSSPFPVGERYLVILLKDSKQEEKPGTQELFNMARNNIYQRKFSKQFDLYLKELQSTIPVFYSE